MSETTGTEVGEIDLAVVAYRDDGRWRLAELPDSALETIESIAHELRRHVGEQDVAVGLISVAEDFALVVRVQAESVRLLLSDATAASDWDLARSAVAHLGLHVGEEDDQTPAGDLGLLADLGLSAHEMAALLEDDELYPEEILSDLAEDLGFGADFDELVGIGE